MEIEEILSQKMNMPQIRVLVSHVTGNRDRLNQLWNYGCGLDRKTSVNALWAMTHLPESDKTWIISLRDEMIGMLLEETDCGKKRILLQLLRDQEYDADNIRPDFLDFCMSKINSECEPYAIRCFSLYTAFKMCRHYPELLCELEEHLEMMYSQPLSPGLKSALRQTKARIVKVRKYFKTE